MNLPPGPIRRIALLGPPGSGKSTLARRLGTALGLPVTHLDTLYHAPGWQPRPASEFLVDVAAATAPSGWVVDGNYLSHTRQRLANADLIVMLDLPLRITLARVLRRTVQHFGQTRPDSASDCPERFDWEFLKFVWTWRVEKRDAMLAALAEHGQRAVVLTDSAAIEQLVAALQPSS